MKKIKKLIILTLVLCSTIAFGQTNIGVFGGLNSSKLSGDTPNMASYNGKMGANIGAFIDLKLTNVLYLSLQPSYSQEGTKISYTLPGIEEPIDSLSIGINYFSLPVLLKVTSTNKRFYALAGFEAGYLLNSSVTIKDDTDDLSSDVQKWNLAMHFGAGYKIPIGYPTFFVELRYSQGLVNLTDEVVEDNMIPRVKTAGIKFLVGIEIPLKKSKK